MNTDAPVMTKATSELPKDRAANVESGQFTSAAAALAYAGALPLLIGVILAWARPADLGPGIITMMTGYGIALLAYFGGVRWGVAVMARRGPSFAQLVGATIPMGLAVIMMQFDKPIPILIGLSVLIPVLLIDDLRATRRGSGAPEWYLGVRLPLTVMMEVSFVAALVFALTHSNP